MLFQQRQGFLEVLEVLLYRCNFLPLEFLNIPLEYRYIRRVLQVPPQKLHVVPPRFDHRLSEVNGCL